MVQLRAVQSGAMSENGRRTRTFTWQDPAVFAVEPAEWMYNPIGSVHGGIAATLLDSCMG